VSPRATGAGRSDQDCDELVGLALNRWFDAQQGELVEESEPVRSAFPFPFSVPYSSFSAVFSGPIQAM
jgi:hypothetical protein